MLRRFPVAGISMPLIRRPCTAALASLRFWSDGRTGTHLPLSFRGWKGTFQPDAIGISRWEMISKFGGFLPGGGPGAASEAPNVPASAPITPAMSPTMLDRTGITGPLPIDCMICHRNQGSGYSPFV